MRPTHKITAVGVGGAAATVASWLIGVVAGVEMPPGVESATAILVAFAAGWLIEDDDPPDV